MKPIPWPLAGEVHLYCLILTQDPSELSRLGGNLSTGETVRIASLKSEPAIRRYIAGRGVLRTILGGYLGVDARSVKLSTGEHGKPFLLDMKESLRFNLSHSGDHFLLAVAVNREVGVDIETIVSGKSLEGMAGMVFSRNEREQLSRLSPPELETFFYRCWVRKEACLKGCGRGFSLTGSSLDLSSLNENQNVLVARCDQKNWHILDIDVPAPHCAALAVETLRPTEPQPVVVRLSIP